MKNPRRLLYILYFIFGLQNAGAIPGLCDCPDGTYMPITPPCDCEDFTCDYVSYCEPNVEVAITNEVSFLFALSVLYLGWILFNRKLKRLMIYGQQMTGIK